MINRLSIQLVFLFCFFLNGCGQTPDKKGIEVNNSDSTQGHPYTNHLINESSPYLLQHAHNPVNWYPWGQEALDKAKKENKLIIISIGYAACHWCHVMEHESFEDITVAKFMNENFISIKIDREERPDIDQVYMNAVQLLTGSGGWPLNVIALPDERPIHGGTYFPKSQWLSMLKQVSEFVTKNPEKAEQQAKALTEGIRRSEVVNSIAQNSEFKIDDLNTIFSNWKNNIDFTNGGYNRAPKFPLPVGYQFLLHYNYLTKGKDALSAVTTTLDKMAEGGIYDQVGGGFARYSTDAYWKVPHFEKMLYDNAQLVSLYASAYQLTKEPLYKHIVYETLDFVERELTSQEGSFYSSLDADSEGEEGKFYVWKKEELQKILGNDAPLIMDYYNVTDKGNWENRNNILFRTSSDKKIAKNYKITEVELRKRISTAKKIMLEERSKKIRPALDDKILTSWNALMLKGYVDAYRVFVDQKFLDVALKNAAFILKNIKTPENRLERNFKNGKSSINGFLDDYAFTIDAFIVLYQATFDEKWLEEAKQLSAYTITHFYDNKSGMFYYTSDIDPDLIARKMEIADNVIPASNSVMAKNLFVLGHYFYDDNYIHKSKKMLENVKQDALKGGAFYANWDILLAWFASEPYEVAIVGKDFKSKLKEFDKYYLPNVFFSGGKDEGKLSLLEGKFIPEQTTIYVCQNKTCKLPVTEVNKAIKLLKKQE